MVRGADVQIYALDIFDDTPRTKAERVGPDILRAVTGVTGGGTFPIYALNLKKIGDAVSALSMELRNQYLIADRRLNLAHDVKWHKITVRMTPPQNPRRLRVYAKRIEGYGGYGDASRNENPREANFFVSFLCHDTGDKHNTCGFPSYSEAIAGCSTFVTI